MLPAMGAVSTDAEMGQRLRPSGATLRGRLAALWRVGKAKPLGTISVVLLVLLILTAIFRSFLAPYDPLELLMGEELMAPGRQHWMGTDHLGRDILSRIIYGAWISLYVGTVAVALQTVIGTLIGLISGYLGGSADLWIQRLMDAIMSIPMLLLAILVMSVLGPGLNNVVVVIAVTGVPRLNRIVRGATMSAVEEDYVLAARGMGASWRRITLRHVLPNIMAPIIVVATMAIGGAILVEASLSFLGMGTPPPTPSWGGELAGNARNWMDQAPWMAVFPGLALGLVVLAVNLLGDAIRDVLDPRLKGR